MGFFFRSEELVKDLAENTDYLIGLSYRWGSPEWLEMRQRMLEMEGAQASKVKKQRGLYKTMKKTGLKAALNSAKDNPDVLNGVLEQIKGALGM